MTFEEAWNATVSRKDAAREIAKHGVPFSEFVAEYGDHEVYRGSDVLGWLGY